MRLIPVLTAIVVTAFLVLAVLQREALFDFARQDHLAMVLGTPENETEAPEAEPEPEVVEAEPETKPEAVRVVARRSQAQVVDSAVVLRGQTEAARQVDVRAETTGLIISEPLRKGAFVNQGQTLCELDAGTRGAMLDEARARLADANAQMPGTRARIPEAEARVAEARARLEEAEINARAAKSLKQDGFASETRVAATEAAVRSAEAGVVSAEAGLETAKSGVETVQAAIRAAEAGVAAAEKEIERLTIKAPFEGLLESDAAELGSLLQAGALCATIIQLDPIKLVGFVPETEVNRVEIGARASARLSEGTEALGRVTFLSRSADPTTRTFRVEIQVPNRGLAIRDGQTAEIAIESDGVPAHLLAQSTLTLNDDGALGIRAVGDGDVARFLPVALIRDTREGVWVSGLPDEVNVITLGQEYVEDGVAVMPVYRETGAASAEATQ